jgi:hypothetical protein
MTKPQIQELARFGAEARLNALQEEQAALLAMFPELRGERRGRKPSNGSAPKAAPPARKRKRMSAAQRKAVGARMKAYWAAKRAEKAGEGGQAEAGNGATSRKSGRKGGRKQGRKK